MHRGFRLLALLLLVALSPAGARATDHEPGDLCTQMMLSTVKIAHPSSTGAALVLEETANSDGEPPRFVLVTAEHALSRVKADQVTLHLRKRSPEGGYAKLEMKLPIRRDEKPLWTKHPSADVAAIRLALPPEAAVPGVPLKLLATQEQWRRYEIHPGDTIRSIGFPHGDTFQPNEAGFGIMRTGCIASYPLLPAKKAPRFFVDVNTFAGDSGGPVFLRQTDRFYQGKNQPGRVELILGLMSGQQFLNERFEHVYQSGEYRRQLGLGIVVHSAMIRETLDLLPEEATESQASPATNDDS
jgi:hypothetical protein